ncbi:MAG: VPS10 domain-containing protein [Flavisolibacter sp.]
MKKPIILLLLCCSCIFAWLHSMPGMTFLSRLTQAIESPEKDKDEEEESESGMAGSLSSWFWARAYPDPYYLEDKYMKGWHQAQAMRRQQEQLRGTGITASGLWNPIGPFSGIGGRILSIAIDPTNNNKLFCGSAGGGIWRSINGGSSWTSVITGFPVVGVASIAIHPTNGNIIYAGTGEVYRVDSTGTTPNPGNTGFSVWKTRGTYGIGILKSTDGGNNWTQVLAKTNAQLFAIQTLKFDPANPNIIYACATDGLYRSTDAGSNWTKIFNVTYVSDVVINGSTLVAAVGNLENTVKGIFRSTDNGASWTKITNGVPASFNGYIKFGYVSSDPNTIVASVGVSESAGVDELYRSTNFGSSWSALSGSTHCQWQYWVAHDVAINPSNTTKLIYGGVNLYAYTTPSTSSSIGTNVHDDVHDIQFDPTNSNIVYVCCDGGIYKSTNASAATPSFSAINNGLGAVQFYASLGVSRTNPSLFVGGLQDNGQIYYNGSGWNTVGGVGGDGTACAIDPSNDNNMVVSRDARGIYLSTNKGVSASANIASYWGKTNDSRTAFAAPVAYAPSNPSIIYAGSDNLHKSVSQGTFSFNAGGASATNYIDAKNKTAIALAVSPVNANKIYASTSNFAQYDSDVDNIYVTGTPNVLRSLTGGTPFTSIKGTGSNVLPNRFVMDFAISKTDDDSVFVAVGGFGTFHIYVTGDGGANWTPAGLGLPDVPFNAVLIDPVDPRVIYAGGDLGVYASPDRGQHWYDFNTGFWDAIQIMDLQATADNQLVAASHGKGAFKGARWSGTLPVNFLALTGQAVNMVNKLSWTVAQEVGVSQYEIERSENGSQFQKIGTIRANNASDYHFSDALSYNKTYYYRVRSVDILGAYQYSGVTVIRRTDDNKLEVLGNPFRTGIHMNITLSRNQLVQINLYDMTGRLIFMEQKKLGAGLNNYSIPDLDILPAGAYHLEAIIDGKSWKEKLVKQ